MTDQMERSLGSTVFHMMGKKYQKHPKLYSRLRVQESPAYSVGMVRAVYAQFEQDCPYLGTPFVGNKQYL